MLRSIRAIISFAALPISQAWRFAISASIELIWLSELSDGNVGILGQIGGSVDCRDKKLAGVQCYLACQRSMVRHLISHTPAVLIDVFKIWSLMGLRLLMRGR
jgi:hypothetical protein